MGGFSINLWNGQYHPQKSCLICVQSTKHWTDKTWHISISLHSSSCFCKAMVTEFYFRPGCMHEVKFFQREQILFCTRPK